MNKVQRLIAFLFALFIVIMQFTIGNIPLPLFSFPINAVCLIVQLGITHVIYNELRHTKTVRLFNSTTASLVFIALTFVCSLIIAFIPRLEFQHSWIFNLVLVLLLANLQMTIMRYKGKFRKRFYVTHIGLYLFIVGLAFGAPDTHKLRAVLYEGQTVDKAYDHEGRFRSIGFPLTLEHFEITYYDNKVPRSFMTTVRSGEERQLIRINHPWTRSWKEDVYLVSHGTDLETGKPYCVLEFVVQPWKYMVLLGVVLTAIGAFLLLLGKKKINRQ